MRDVTLGGGLRALRALSERKNLLGSRVSPENGRLRTWVTKMKNLTVSLLIFWRSVFTFHFYLMWAAYLSTKILHSVKTA